MARVKVLAWRGIPGQVQARDDGARPVSRALPEWFQQEIDRVAMREGLAGSDEYLDLWEWSPEEDRPGSAEEVAEAVALELMARWGRKASNPVPAVTTRQADPPRRADNLLVLPHWYYSRAVGVEDRWCLPSAGRPATHVRPPRLAWGPSPLR